MSPPQGGCRFRGSSVKGALTGPVQKLLFLQIDVLRWLICKETFRLPGGMMGIVAVSAQAPRPVSSAICTEIKIWKGGIGFSRSGQPQDVGSIGGFRKLEFEKSASNRGHRGMGFPTKARQAPQYRSHRHR